MKTSILDLPWRVYSRDESVRSGPYAIACFPLCCDGFNPIDHLTIAAGNPRSVDCGIYPPALGAGGVSHEDMYAAMRLMAAAPDLLAACREAEFLAAYGVGAVHSADAHESLKANAERCVGEARRIQALLRAAIAKAEATGGAA